MTLAKSKDASELSTLINQLDSEKLRENTCKGWLLKL